MCRRYRQIARQFCYAFWNIEDEPNIMLRIGRTSLHICIHRHTTIIMNITQLYQFCIGLIGYLFSIFVFFYRWNGEGRCYAFTVFNKFSIDSKQFCFFFCVFYNFVHKYAHTHIKIKINARNFSFRFFFFYRVILDCELRRRKLLYK